MAVFPTGHCTARISMSHRPSPSTARSTSPATTSPTAGWLSGCDHVTCNNVTNSRMAFGLGSRHRQQRHQQPDGFLAGITSPATTSPTARWLSGWDHVTGNNVTHTHRTHGLAFAFLLLLLSHPPPPHPLSLSHKKKQTKKNSSDEE